MDADDIWHPDKLKLQLNFMKQNNINFCYSSYQIIDTNEKIIKKIIAPKEINYKDLLYACNIGLSSVMMGYKVLQKNKFTNLKTKEDYLLWLRLSKKKIKMKGMKEILFTWRKTDNSLSSSLFQKLNDALKVYNHHLRFNLLKSIFLTIMLSINFILKRFF